MARKIIEYNILTETDIIRLQQFVSSQLQLGWEPIGGPFVVRSPLTGNTTLGQAMVFYEKRKDKK